MVRGEATPEQMAQLARRRLRSKIPVLERALEGRMETQHRHLLAIQLDRLEHVDADLDKLDRRIDERLEPYREAHTRLMQIPGVDWVVAAVRIAELGDDMSVFHSVHHLAAWAGVCPGNHESAGKRRSGRVRPGNVLLKTILVEAATAAARTKGSYFKDKFFRLKARRGYKRAAMAIAHKILIAAYHMLSAGEAYHELGEAYLDRIGQQRITLNLVRRLERMGYHVQLVPRAA